MSNDPTHLVRDNASHPAIPYAKSLQGQPALITGARPADEVAPSAVRTPINTSAWCMPEVYAYLMRLEPYQRIGGMVLAGGMMLYPGIATDG
jgi:hypothetical protein